MRSTAISTVSHRAGARRGEDDREHRQQHGDDRGQQERDLEAGDRGLGAGRGEQGGRVDDLDRGTASRGLGGLEQRPDLGCDVGAGGPVSDVDEQFVGIELDSQVRRGGCIDQHPGRGHPGECAVGKRPRDLDRMVDEGGVADADLLGQ